jgi:predicted acyl esterase
VTAESPYELRETKDVLIPMRDGVHLAANLLVPEGTGPVPAIIVYFPYLKDGPHGRGDILDWQRHFAERGYACLTVDMRGTGASEGTQEPPFAASEKEDAVDMLGWIAGQSWCDGTTGMWGISYSGSSALAAASLRPPSLKAIVPLHGTANEFIGFLWPHGCKPAWWTEASWGPTMVLYSLLPPLHRDPARRWATVWRERLAALEPIPFSWHRTPFDDYMAWRTDASAVEAAMYAVSAWHDYYPQATLDYAMASGGPARVLIGPWKHEFPDTAVTGQIDHRGEMDRWWDHWLKGFDNGADDRPPVMIWRQGEDRWSYEERWPPAGAETLTLHAATDGALTGAAPAGPHSDIHRLDPTVGLHLLPWDPQAPVVPQPYDRSADDHRSLTYTTQPLDEALSLRGQPEVVVHLESDMGEHPLSVWLSDVDPSGHATLICQGWISVAREAGGPLEQGRVYELTVPLYSTSYRIAAGHRLRLGISPGNFPLLWPATRGGEIRVHGGADRPTRVVLPVMPPGADRSDGPEFEPPTIPPSPQRQVPRSSNQLIRELDDSRAEFRQQDESVTALDDATLTLRMTNRSSTVRGETIENVLTARMEAVVETAADRVDVTLDAVQTAELYVFDAEIRIDNAVFYRRHWELPLAPPAL